MSRNAIIILVIMLGLGGSIAAFKFIERAPTCEEQVMKEHSTDMAMARIVCEERRTGRTKVDPD